MNAFKEFYSDYERLSELKKEEINFAKNNEYFTKKSLQKDFTPVKRGLTFSLPDFLIFGSIDENILKLTINRTSSRNMQLPSQNNFFKQYKFIFKDLIVDNVNIQSISDEAILITIFTLDSHVYQIEIDNFKPAKISSVTYDNLNVTCVEYLNFDGSNVFALGSSNGSIYLVALQNLGNNLLNIQILDEIKKLPTNLTEKLSSYMPISLNLFHNKSQTHDKIVTIKYIGNNLIAYTTEQLNFKIYNFEKRKEIYSICLIKNRQEEILEKSNISFLNFNLTSAEFSEYRSKSFIFTVYMKYGNNINVIQTFEMWFNNIPFINIQNTPIPNDLFGFEKYYNSVDLGTEVKIKNTRIYKLNGRLIDFVNYKKKIWALSENSSFDNKNLSHNEENKYDLRVFYVEQDNIFNSDQSVIFLESSLVNALNILNQIVLYKNYNIEGSMNIENKLLNALLTDEEYIPTDLLLSYYNKEANKNIFTSKLQILAHIQKKQCSSENLIEAIKSILEDNLLNEVIAFGFFTTNDIDGLSLVRNNGISLIKTMTNIDLISNQINHYEIKIRNNIFSEFNISKEHDVHWISELQNKIYQYITIESKTNPDNILFIIFALLRIYLTESNLLIQNEQYITEYLEEKKVSEFIKIHFKENLSNQFSNLNNLDFFHGIISNVYKNNKNFIDLKIHDFISKYENYSSIRREEIDKIKIEAKKNSSYIREKYNSKFCEIVSKCVNDRIYSYYKIFRDILSFNCWNEIYNKTSTIDNSKKLVNIYLSNYSTLIMSSHECKINIKEGSIIDKILIVGDYCSNYASLADIILYENLYNYGFNLFDFNFYKKTSDLDYIDYIIVNTWPDVMYDEKSKNYVSTDKNKNIRFEIMKKLMKMDEFKLISLILKIENRNNLVTLFLEILCEVNSDTNKDNTYKLKKLLNNYFSMIIDIDNGNFSKFEEFYVEFFLLNNRIQNHKNSNNIITGYYYLEEILKKYLKEDLKYEFYFSCYTFIYPALLDLNYLNRRNDSSSDLEKTRIEDFLLNMIKSCIVIDIDLATSLYSSIKDSFDKFPAMTKIVPIFVEYILKNSKSLENNFLVKIANLDRDFISAICDSLEQNCKGIKDNRNIINLLFSKLRLITQNLMIGNLATDGIYNYFILLYEIYLIQGDYQKASEVMFSYYEGINDVIKFNDFDNCDLLQIYKEIISSLNNVQNLLQKIENSSSSTLFIKKNDSINIKFVSKQEIRNLILLANIKVQIIQTNFSYGNYENMNKLNNTNVMLNFIFKFNLLNIITEYNLINQTDLFDDLTLNKLIINFIRIHFISHKDTVETNQQLYTFYEQITETNNSRIVLTSIEALLFIHNYVNIPEILFDFATRNCPVNLFEVLIKYSRNKVINFLY